MPDKYYITINGEKVSVSEEIYTVYRQMRRCERTLAEKDARHYVVRYEDFSTGEMTGEEQIYDPMQICVEDIVLSKLIYRKLHRALNLLPQSECEIILDIYFSGYSLRSVAEKQGVSRMTVQRKAKEALAMLKKLMEN